MTSPASSQIRPLIGVLWCTLVLFLDATNTMGAQYRSLRFHQQVDPSTAGLSDASNVVMEAPTLLGCAVKCSMSSNCTGIVWDSVSTSCTMGIFVYSSSDVLASSSTLYFAQPKCRLDLGYRMASYNNVTRCLRVSDDKVVYSEAKRKCLNDGGRLFKANSWELIRLANWTVVDKAVFGEVKQATMGLDDVDSEDNFVWSDGEPMTLRERTELFDSTQTVNSESDDCVKLVFYTDKLLNVYDCHVAKFYICEIVI